MGLKSKFFAVTELVRGCFVGGVGARMQAGSRLRAQRGARVELGRKVHVGRRTRIAVGSGAQFSIGDKTHIRGESIINCAHSIRIGRECQISWRVQILDTDFHSIFNDKGEAKAHTGAVVLGDHVWIGTQAIILKGVAIGEGAVVAAGSVVTRDVPPYTVVAGNPARVVGAVSKWN